MSKTYKIYDDRDGDALVVDTGSREPSSVIIGPELIRDTAGAVLLQSAQVKRLVKQLSRWLVENGHVEKKDKAPRGIPFDIVVTCPEDEPTTVVAVTLQDKDGRVLETIWER